MGLALFRIDERLIHGQVVVGWGTRLGIERYVVVDDDLAESEWEQELWSSALGEAGSVDFLSVAETCDRFDELDARPGVGGLLTRGTGPMRALAEAGRLAGRRINVGGLHDGPGRSEHLDYVFLSPEERADLAAIADLAGSVSARQLPTGPETPLDELLAS
ncbi:MAG: PTS sugar transporter subunit IIB [Gemmatimonadetes bacterium]|nr:PTS sugar transporter subunit IIB [Gemmatimonadota bacterium]